MTPDEVVARTRVRSSSVPHIEDELRSWLGEFERAGLVVVDATDTPTLGTIKCDGCGNRVRGWYDHNGRRLCSTCRADVVTGGSRGERGTTDENDPRHEATPDCIWSIVDPHWCNTHARYFRCPASTSGMCLELVESGKPCPAGECDRTPGERGTAEPRCPDDPHNEGIHMFGDDGICIYCGKVDMLRERGTVTQETSADETDATDEDVATMWDEGEGVEVAYGPGGSVKWTNVGALHNTSGADTITIAGPYLGVPDPLPFPNAYPGPQVDGQPTWGAYLRDVPDDGYEICEGETDSGYEWITKPVALHEMTDGSWIQVRRTPQQRCESCGQVVPDEG